MIEVVMKVDDEFWDNITQLTVFKEQKEITYCKDCKYMKVHGWNPKKEVSTCHYHCEFWNHAVDDCDFCSRGERK